VVAGRWDVRRGENTEIYYHPAHHYNIDEMSEALDAARRYYSQWFYPYPWQELKLSEFPALATYAQGFATNITFSEGIGFLTRSEPRTNLAFMVTAHEAAHQWWGNILMPGKGPGGNILSEGMAHFSTALLIEQVKGLRHRIEFCRRMEEDYGENRVVDSERPLVKIDGTRPGDRTVTYNKGGWVFWMLLNVMGRDACLAGLQDFIGHYSSDPDFPVLQDFVASMRPSGTTAAIRTSPSFRISWRRCVPTRRTGRRSASASRRGSSVSSCPSTGSAMPRWQSGTRDRGLRPPRSRTGARPGCPSRSRRHAARGLTTTGLRTPSTARLG
jgi:hypothetical protein